jgi:hypothetical protein
VIHISKCHLVLLFVPRIFAIFLVSPTPPPPRPLNRLPLLRVSFAPTGLI